MSTVRELQTQFPHTFRAIEDFAGDHGMYLCLETEVPEDYVDLLAQAETVYADLSTKTIGDIVKDVQSEYTKDFQDRKHESAFVEFVMGEYYFQGLISDYYGVAGDVASRILADIAEAKTDFTLVSS